MLKPERWKINDLMKMASTKQEVDHLLLKDIFTISKCKRCQIQYVVHLKVFLSFPLDFRKVFPLIKSCTFRYLNCTS